MEREKKTGSPVVKTADWTNEWREWNDKINEYKSELLRG